jgi:hypothetical protein
MNPRARAALRVVTVLLFITTGWMVFANVLSDDNAVRARADALAREQAGCGTKCKVRSVHGGRGMIQEKLEYEIDGKTPVTVACQRAYIAFGDYVCEASGGAALASP